jgi:hypothetical protein
VGLLGLACSLSYPGADKRIERLAQNGKHGFEPFPDLPCVMRGVKSNRGHGGLLAKPQA